mgnify:CR=1 FL=1
MVNLSRENFSFDPNVIIGQFIPNIAQLPSDVSLFKEKKIQFMNNWDLNIIFFCFCLLSGHIE